MSKYSKTIKNKLIRSIKRKTHYFTQYKYSFHPRSNCQYKLLTNGDQFYPSMLKDIDNAKTSIYIIQYIFQSSLTATEFINALVNASKRNVKVSLSLDAYGSSKLSNQDRNKLDTAGISTNIYNPFNISHIFKFLYRDHRKLLVIDDNIAYIGGAGISDDYNFPIAHPSNWQDIVIKITGELASDCANLAKKIPSATKASSPVVNGGNAYLDLCSSQGRLLISKSWHRNEIQRAIIAAMSKSKKRIWITTPYFVPSRKLRKKLKAAAHHGCDVRLLLPGKISDHPWINYIARNNYQKMLNAGVKIYEFQNIFSHAKAILCDDWICIGSSNLDRWNQKFNHELNIEAQTLQLANELTQFFENNFRQAIQINHNKWKKRPLAQRIKEYFWCKTAIWIERLLRKLH